MFPGNQTHNLLHCWCNALPLSHRNTLISKCTVYSISVAYLTHIDILENVVNTGIINALSANNQNAIFFTQPTRPSAAPADITAIRASLLRTERSGDAGLMSSLMSLLHWYQTWLSLEGTQYLNMLTVKGELFWTYLDLFFTQRWLQEKVVHTSYGITFIICL